MAFVRRQITLRFQLGQQSTGGTTLPKQTFGPDGSDVVTLEGLRVSAVISKAGTPSGATLTMQVYGMRLELMNKLATLGMVYSQIRRNVVTVLAGDEGAVPAVAFTGTILQAWIDFTAMPDVAFHVEAQTLGAESVIPADPTSIQGSADVAQLMKGFADKMGLSFENNGIDAKIPNPYFYGSLVAQAAAVANAAGINWFVDNDVLAIWKKGKSRSGTVPLISPQTGMVGYPGFTAYGITIKTVFNADIRFQADVKVESSLEGVARLNANGIWTVYNIDHEIESIVPEGRWFTSLICYNKNFPPPLVR